ncbi:hypothetical protein J4Q44_G00226680 [Coregonus suidteri]|uniref:Uncharacterized protein n=1 Tax=Coregonus suidteri TaxID=861788 RepID=A0AAN8QLF5_9TELE
MMASLIVTTPATLHYSGLKVLDVEELKATHSPSRSIQVHPPHQEEGNSAFYNIIHTILNQNKQPKKFLSGTTILCYFLSLCCLEESALIHSRDVLYSH